MSAQGRRLHAAEGRRRDESDRLAEYIEEIIAQAPPMSDDARAKLSALLGNPQRRRAA
ncbi:hypothetical protein [Nocardia xishanensis]|uniref:hypothetical protein n=1 Tax=Nocardia xishanensis TaxID=238964 RepID=UPI000AB9D9E3|nr:hypothetical protein [Nocardia xishanensis]